jgi:hypothetical protein
MMVCAAAVIVVAVLSRRQAWYGLLGERMLMLGRFAAAWCMPICQVLLLGGCGVSAAVVVRV